MHVLKKKKKDETSNEEKMLKERIKKAIILKGDNLIIKKNAFQLILRDWNNTCTQLLWKIRLKKWCIFSFVV